MREKLFSREELDFVGLSRLKQEVQLVLQVIQASLRANQRRVGPKVMRHVLNLLCQTVNKTTPELAEAEGDDVAKQLPES